LISLVVFRIQYCTPACTDTWGLQILHATDLLFYPLLLVL